MFLCHNITEILLKVEFFGFMPLSTIFQLYCGRGTYKGFLGLCHFQQYFSYIVAEEHIRGFWVYATFNNI
jgi:hypothetical protein